MLSLPNIMDQSDSYLKTLKKLRKNDPQMYERVKKKMVEILDNPEHFKPLSKVLKKYRRAHVGAFVIAFRIIENEKKVKFVAYDHHDKIYKRSFSE